ncbi:MAG: hypothetical protein LBV02_08525 [Bacteroidales bacterium]|nr:hypothetical protein [Bacteroidales bacterium]
MKKIALFLVLFSFCAIGSAQTENNPVKPFRSHEISFNIGDPAFIKIFTDYYYNNYYYNYGSWMRDDTYTGLYITTPTLTFTYLYRPLKWLWLGGCFAYTGEYRIEYDKFSEEKIGSNNASLLSLAPYIRFSYLNKEKVNLYSGFGLAMTYEIKSSTVGRSRHWLSTEFTGQMTFFGVSFGKTVVGFAEVGFGYKGIINMGIGYRFDSKKK